MKKIYFHHKGFSLLEIILMITILSILAVPVLNNLISSQTEQNLTFNEIDRVAKNTDEIFSSILKQASYGLTPEIAGYIYNLSIDCNTTQSSTTPLYLLCKNSLGDNTRYTISANTVDETLNLAPFNNRNIFKLTYTISFFTRSSSTSSWKSYTSLNRTLEVIK